MNVLPDYYALLKEAQDTSEAADNFNVISGNPTAMAQFKELCAASDEASKKLITYVVVNFDGLKENFEIELPSDKKEEVSDEEE